MAYILVVDDDQDFADAVAMMLTASGHEVAIALDTATGAQRMEERIPDLVVLDVMFPEDSNAGFDLARKMKRESETLRDVPILMLTAVNEESPVKFSSQDIDGAWLPVSDFLEKPVDLDVLKARVNALLGRPHEAEG